MVGSGWQHNVGGKVLHATEFGANRGYPWILG